MKLIDSLSKILFFGPKFNLKLGNIAFEPSYIQAGIFIVLIFILIITLAQVRRHFMDYSIKGAIFGLFFGFILALIFEGFLIVNGKTAVTRLFGWKNPPSIISGILEKGKQDLINNVCK